MDKVRKENDSFGQVTLPFYAYYGAQTQRAINNFPISNLLPDKTYIYATVVIKKAAAVVNQKLNLLEEKKSQAIIQACDEIILGKYLDQFVVDPYQAGAGTSHNMNINEVIANRANEILGAPLGSYKYIHPNDDVNMAQSTNDVIPTAIRILTLKLLPDLFSNVNKLELTFGKKAKDFSKIIKSGRTHLQDALPVTLGQEFNAYAKALNNDLSRIKKASQNLQTLGIGGTAVGTGINSHPQYHKIMIAELSRLTDLSFKTSDNLFELMQNTADFLEVSSCIKILAQNLIRIGNDLRLLSSGPRAGLSEIILPEVQPGSSIMPGKINPSIVEMLTMVCFQVMGFDQALLFASASGQLELNVFLPLIAYNLSQQIKLMTNAINIFNQRCVSGIKVNKEMCQFWFERGSGIAAILNPHLGYDKTAKLVQESLKTDRPLKQLVVEKKLLTKEQVSKIFSSDRITKPNI